MSQQAVQNESDRLWSVSFGRRSRKGYLMGLMLHQLVGVCISVALAIIFVALLPFPTNVVVALVVLGAGAAFSLINVEGSSLLQLTKWISSYGWAELTGQNEYFNDLQQVSAVEVKDLENVAKALKGAVEVERKDIVKAMSKKEAAEYKKDPEKFINSAESQGDELFNLTNPFSKKTEYLSAPTGLKLPGADADLKLYKLPKSGAAMVFDRRRKTVAATALVQSSSFALDELDGQKSRVQIFSQFLASLADQRGVSRFVSFNRTTASSSKETADFYEKSVAEARARGDKAGAEVSMPLAHSYKELVSKISRTPQQQSFVTVVMSKDLLKDELAEQRKKGMREIDGMADLLEQWIETNTDDGLKNAGAQVERWLDPGQLCTVIRQAYDSDVSDFLKDENEEDRRIAAHNAGPMYAKRQPKLLRTDNLYHRTYQIAEMPRRDVEPGFLAPILFASGDFTHSLAMVYKPNPAEKALKEIEGHIADLNTNETLRRKLGKDLTLAQMKEKTDTYNREAELVAGHGDTDMTGYVTLTADSEEDLKRYETTLKTAATRSHIDLRVCLMRQDRAFMAGALPLGRGIDD